MHYTLTFGEALEALKLGARIQREGWNGKNMFLFLLPAGTVPKTAIHDPALRKVLDKEVPGDSFEALGSIRMFTADKKVLTGWLASQTDMLSNDWGVVGEVGYPGSHLDVRFKLDQENPGRAWVVGRQFMIAGQSVHCFALRVHDVGGVQVAWEGTFQLDVEGLQAACGDSALSTVKIDGLEGDWVISMIPYGV